jgi:hypothetical protein
LTRRYPQAPSGACIGPTDQQVGPKAYLDRFVNYVLSRLSYPVIGKRLVYWAMDWPVHSAVFYPLDGSSNIDASIPTGTIWGLYKSDGSKGRCFLMAKEIRGN